MREMQHEYKILWLDVGQKKIIVSYIEADRFENPMLPIRFEMPRSYKWRLFSPWKRNSLTHKFVWFANRGDTITVFGGYEHPYKVLVSGRTIFYSLRGHLQHVILGRQPDFVLFLLAVALATIAFAFAELLSR